MTAPLPFRATDLALGGACLLIAGTAFWIARDYEFGELAEMGPGFLPVSISALLGLVGILIVLGGGRDPEESTGEPYLEELPQQSKARDAFQTGRVLLGILGAVLLFAVTVQRLGLALSTAILVLVAGAARRGATPIEMMILALAVATFCSVVFVGLLGIRLPVFPT